MNTNLFKKIIYFFVFLLSFTNIMRNLYNTDNSLILESNSILNKLALNRDSTDYYGITSSITACLTYRCNFGEVRKLGELIKCMEHANFTDYGDLYPSEVRRKSRKLHFPVILAEIGRICT